MIEYDSYHELTIWSSVGKSSSQRPGSLIGKSSSQRPGSYGMFEREVSSSSSALYWYLSEIWCFKA